jgi:hypothetical protein
MLEEGRGRGKSLPISLPSYFQKKRDEESLRGGGKVLEVG